MLFGQPEIAVKGPDEQVISFAQRMLRTVLLCRVGKDQGFIVDIDFLSKVHIAKVSGNIQKIRLIDVSLPS
ncbi:hypothetical protein D9M70_592060 [compost metagenome]